MMSCGKFSCYLECGLLPESEIPKIILFNHIYNIFHFIWEYACFIEYDTPKGAQISLHKAENVRPAFSFLEYRAFFRKFHVY